MASLIFVSAAALLYPVSADDLGRMDETTYVSADATAAAASASDETSIHCLELPRNAASHARVCLTEGEWQLVFDQVKHKNSVAARERAIGLALRDRGLGR